MNWKNYKQHRDRLDEAGLANMWDDDPPAAQPAAQPAAPEQDMPPIDYFIQRGRQAKAYDALYPKRVALFDALKHLFPEVKQYDYRNSQQAASQLYNALGRSAGILQKIKDNPQVLDRVLTSWFKLAMEGEVPLPV